MLLPISKRFIWIFYCEGFDKLIDGIADWFQQPDLLVRKHIQEVFVKLCSRNTYDKSIVLVADMDNFEKNHGKKHLMLAKLLLIMPAINAGAIIFGIKHIKITSKLHFKRYSCVVIIFFNKNLCKSVFSTHSLREIVFRLSVFSVYSLFSAYSLFGYQNTLCKNKLCKYTV